MQTTPKWRTGNDTSRTGGAERGCVSGSLPVPGRGQRSQWRPQALPTLQQHNCLLSCVDTGCKHCFPELTNRKQAPFSSRRAGVSAGYHGDGRNEGGEECARCMTQTWKREKEQQKRKEIPFTLCSIYAWLQCHNKITTASIATLKQSVGESMTETVYEKSDIVFNVR